MTAPNLLDELEGVVRLCDKASAMLPSAEGTVAIKEAETAATNWVITHHATLADMAKRLEAAERDAARYRHIRLRLWPGEVEDAVDIYPGMAALDMAVCEDHGKQIDAAIDAATQEGEG